MNKEQALTEEDLSFRFGTGSLCLDFIATVGNRDHDAFERLRQPDDLVRWLKEAGVLNKPLSATRYELTQAQKLRELIFELIESVRLDTEPNLQHIAELNRWAVQPALYPQLQHHANGYTSIMEGPVTAALAMVVHDAIRLLGGSYARRIRCCAAESCSIRFVDTSRPNKRRWCSMARCGNRAKKASYRQRHTT